MCSLQMGVNSHANFLIHSYNIYVYVLHVSKYIAYEFASNHGSGGCKCLCAVCSIIRRKSCCIMYGIPIVSYIAHNNGFSSWFCTVKRL